MCVSVELIKKMFNVLHTHTHTHTSFLLCWLIIPFQQSYFESGEFTFKTKCKSSLKANLKFYGVMAVLLGGCVCVCVCVCVCMCVYYCVFFNN